MNNNIKKLLVLTAAGLLLVACGGSSSGTQSNSSGGGGSSQGGGGGGEGSQPIDNGDIANALQLTKITNAGKEVTGEYQLTNDIVYDSFYGDGRPLPTSPRRGGFRVGFTCCRRFPVGYGIPADD